jgi:DNA (cytosine-5)-methyltransferase 1
MEYISCFSGIGGLEGYSQPIALCEIDKACQSILKKRYPQSLIHSDINTFPDISADILVGGWPCQDLSIAGKQKGLSGENSGLFYSFVKVAIQSSVQTIIAENVLNLIRLENGNVFKEVLREFTSQGYNYCAWRVLNVRQFGLPHHRNRVFMIASKYKRHCDSLFRELPKSKEPSQQDIAYGFYWTAGTQSINYSKGYVPTIKVGSSLSIPSPPAIHYEDIVRQLTPDEALSLQGFNPKHFEGLNKSTIYKMAGNAVAVPVGKFVVDGVLNDKENKNIEYFSKQSSLKLYDEVDNFDFPGGIPSNGCFDGEMKEVIVPKPSNLAINLREFLDLGISARLSQKAATGLLRRLKRSGQVCPSSLKRKLEEIRGDSA